MPFLSAVCLKDIPFAQERVDRELSLLAFGPLLENHFMLSFAESFCQHYHSVLSCHHELSVRLWSHLLVHPQVEPAVLCV